MVKSLNKVNTFWIIFFAVIAVLAISLAVFYVVNFSNQIASMRATTINDDNYYKRSLENDINDNLYATVESLSAIDTLLGKVAVTKDANMQHQLLQDIAVETSSLAVSVGHLPLRDSDNKYQLENCINTLYQYSTSLNAHIARGDKLSAEDIATLVSARPAIKAVYEQFNSLALDNGTLAITNSMRSDGSNIIDKAITSMDGKVWVGQEYTGSFGIDTTKQIELKDKVDQSTAKEIATEHLQTMHNIDVNNIVCNNAPTNVSPYYYMTANTKEGAVSIVLQRDGTVAQLEVYANVVGQPVEDVGKLAQQYCSKLGYDVQPIGMPQDGLVQYVTLCPIVDGIVLYPDTIKVGIDKESGAVVAYNATMYLVNHTDRELKFGKFDTEQLSKGIDDSAKVLATNKVLIMHEGQEMCCHELVLSQQEDMYLLHVNSDTGEHIKMSHLNSTSSLIDR